MCSARVVEYINIVVVVEAENKKGHRRGHRMVVSATPAMYDPSV